MKYPVRNVRNNLYHYAAVLRRAFFQTVYGMTIGENTRISRHARLDKTNPKGVHIGSHSSITFGVSILTHDFVNRRHVDTFVGDYTFIGGNAMILPGVRVGNHCIIGSGSVVTHDIPDNSIAAGNPARIIREGIQTKEYGILVATSPDDTGNHDETD